MAISCCVVDTYGQLFYHLLLPTEPHQKSPESSLCFYSLSPHPPSFLPWYIFTEHNISPDPPLRKHEQWMICLLYKSDKPVNSDLQKLCGKSSWWINRWIFVGPAAIDNVLRTGAVVWTRLVFGKQDRDCQIVRLSPGTWSPWRGRRGTSRRSPSCSRTDKAPTRETSMERMLNKEKKEKTKWFCNQTDCHSVAITRLQEGKFDFEILNSLFHLVESLFFYHF